MEFIVKYIREIFNRDSKEFKVVVAEKNMLDDNTKKEGLYMLFVSPKGVQVDRLHPIYVGYTSRPFDVQFKEHARKEKGVLEKFFTRGEPEITLQGVKKECDLYVIELPLDPRAAKLLESVFLEAFDFTLNTEENGPKRKSVELSAAVGPLLSKAIFTQAWQTVTQDVRTMIHVASIDSVLS